MTPVPPSDAPGSGARPGTPTLSHTHLCALVPTYDNPRTIEAVVETIRQSVPDIIVVDDGSGPEARAILEDLGRTPGVRVHRRPHNGGKGAAVKTGFELARQAGFTHVFQIDADGQHDLSRIPAFVEIARQHPRALVLGRPVFDASAPRSRLQARRITQWWTHIETMGRVIEDPMCGFRIYPLDAISAVRCRADRMAFDIEIAVRLVWAGTPVINEPVGVRYLAAHEGGVSHFRLWGDNVAISACHTRLVIGSILLRLRRLFSPARPKLEDTSEERR